ncbi:MAG: (Fe-S)-binding protein [Coriobacteriia bacterium]|nr:(Fe-S)-binding protein [Coriobacteriia bacterium]
MGLLECSKVYWEFTGQCTQCGHCTKACASLSATDMTLGGIAKALLRAERNAGSVKELRARIVEDTRLVQAVRSCFLCDLCTNTCFAHNDANGLVYHARVDFQNLALIPSDTWLSLQVDQEWDIFTAYRSVYNIDFSDLRRHMLADGPKAQAGFDLAFFPGCSLAAYAPELTREIFASLEELGREVTLIDRCCGSPLKNAGFFNRAEALCNHIAEEILGTGATKLVCVCPGCANNMETAFVRNNLQIETISLSAFLTESGFIPKRDLPDAPLCLSRSCQDHDGSYLEETCSVLGIDSFACSVFEGCCGAGGSVATFDHKHQSQQTERKLQSVPKGSTVVSMCPTCTYTYALYLSNNRRDEINKHYTELLFESQIDWDTVFDRFGCMWTGETGAWLAHVLT